MEQKSIKKNSFFSFLNAFTSLLFPVITFPYASRILTPEGIGQVNFATSIEGYFSMLAGLGIGSYAIREAAKLRDNKIELTKFCKEMIATNFISMIIAYSLLILSVIFIPKLRNYRILILVRSVNIFFTTIGLEWLYRANEDYKYITMRSMIFKFAGLAFLFAFVRKQGDTIQYIIFGILTSVASNIYNLFHSRKYIDYKQHCKLELIKHIRPIMTFFGLSVITSVYTVLDTSMLGFLADDIQVGYYSAATKLNRMTLGMLASITAVILPRLSYYKQKGEEEKFSDLADKSLSINTLLSLPLMVGLIFLAKPLITIFCGDAYLPAVKAMNIISPILFLIGTSGIIGAQIFPAIGKEKITLISVGIGAATNLTMNLIFIPKLGAIGAALGTTIAESVVLCFQLCFIRSIFTKKHMVNFLQSLFGTATEACIIALIKNFVSSNVLQIVLSIVANVIVYYILLIVLKNETITNYTNIIKNRVKSHIRK